jgi:peptide chain release factor 1
MKVLMEIRAGEGGQDAKLLVSDLAKIYARFAETNGASVSIEERSGL